MEPWEPHMSITHEGTQSQRVHVLLHGHRYEPQVRRKGTVKISTEVTVELWSVECHGTTLWPRPRPNDCFGSPSFTAWPPYGSISFTRSRAGGGVLARSTRPPPVRMSSWDHALRLWLWVRFCPRITPMDIFSDGSHDQRRARRAKLCPLPFWGSLVVLGKLVPFSHPSFPDEVTWGWLYSNNLALPMSRPPRGEFCCRSPVLVLSEGLVPEPWLNALAVTGQLTT